MPRLLSAGARAAAPVLIGVVALTIGAERAVGQTMQAPAELQSDTTVSASRAELVRLPSGPTRLVPLGHATFVLGAKPASSTLHITPVVARIQESDRSGRVSMGVVFGALAGAVVGRVVAGDGCRSGFSGCDGAASIAVVTAGGAILGAIVGGTIGALR